MFSMSQAKPDFSGIRVIGFDLDQTLYPKSAAIDEAIQSYLYEKIAAHRKVSRKSAKKLFTDLYRHGSGMSGSQTMEALGLPDGRRLVQEALERADIAASLLPDEEANAMLEELRKKFEGFDVITGSNHNQLQKKLAAISIPEQLFNNVITDEDGPKSDGSAFKIWLSRYPHLSSEQFLYIGDRVSTDYEVPKSFGIRAVLVNQEKFNLAGSCVQLPSLIALRDIL